MTILSKNLYLQHQNASDKTWKNTFCQVSKIMAKNGPNVYVNYWIDDSNGSPVTELNKYASDLDQCTPIIGEIFHMSYNPKN